MSRIKEFLVQLLALNITDQERLRYAHGPDPGNIFFDDFENRRPLRVAAILAILLHLLLFFLIFPSFGEQIIPQQEVIVLRSLAQPAELKGGSPPEPAAPKPKPEPVVPKPKPILVPIPDPTPLDPEPIERQATLDVPSVIDEVAAELNIGDITAPSSGAGRGRAGSGTGPSEGIGPAAGAGGGIYTVGSGVTNPVLLRQTIPSYTDDAIKAKVQGVVLLQAVIRKDGTVTDFKVLRGLGYGLEERAIQEIATNWKFRPGTLDGQPVNVRATIEVQFNLR